MGITLDQLIQSLSGSGLLSVDEVASLKERLSEAAVDDDDAETLARALVASGKLTEYQAEVVCQGKADTLVFGEYTVLDRIGAGGMGEVLKAEHRTMERIVAIKVLPEKQMGTPDAVKRFHQEVKAAAKLMHPNVVAAHDAGHKGDLHFLVMEYVEGHDLSSVIRHDGPLSVDKGIDVIRQTAQGLEYAHSEGIIHRDIKPANLLLDKKGTVKILDMGLARVEAGVGKGETGEGLTVAGQIMGTADYIAPEQGMDPRKADARSDVYSLGCTLYRLLTGKPPFRGETVMLQIMAHVEQPIPSLREARPDVPESLEALYQPMMAKKPEDRPQTMSDVVAALDEIARGDSRGKDSASDGSPPDGNLAGFLDQMRQAPIASADAGRHSESIAATKTAAPVTRKTAPTTEETVDFLSRDDTSRSNAASEEQVAAPSAVLNRTAQHRQPVARRRRRKMLPLLMLGIGAAISLVGAAVVGVVIYVQTNYGTIVVDARDENIEVSVKSGGNEIAVVDAKHKWRIDIKSGEYQVELKGGDDRFTLDQDTVTVTRNGKVRVKVERKPAQITERRGPSRLSPPGAVDAPAATNGALEFDGKTACVEIPTLTLEAKQPITIEALVQPRSAGPASVFQFGSKMRIGIFHAGHWWCTLGEGLGIASAVSDRPASVGKTVHFASVFDGHRLRLFVDGQPQLVSTKGNLPKLEGIPLRVGGTDFQIIIDEVRISRSARYREPFVPSKRLASDDQTLALLHFDEQGDVATDASGNGNDGYIQGVTRVKSPDYLPPTATPAVRDIESLPSPDLRAAAWVASVGGGVYVDPVQTGGDLEKVVLSRAKLKGSDLVGLREARGIQRLDLDMSTVGDEGLSHLPGMDSLHTLWLAQTNVTDAGMGHLATLPRLADLRIQHTAITDVGVERIASMRQLNFLYLDGTQVTDRCVPHLKQITNLKQLNLVGTGITAAGIAELREVLKDCEISGP